MIELIATAESVEQSKQLLEAGADWIIVGEDEFGLRLPYSFSLEEIKEVVEMAHTRGKKVIVAVNALMHNDRIEKVPHYLKQLEALHVDAITTGDPGVVRILQKNNSSLAYIYDAQTMVTNSTQINFWAKRGAIGAVLARELTYEELTIMSQAVTVPVEILVYGATCIHQSKRLLVNNYFNYVNKDVPEAMKKRELFLSESNAENHYSIYEDINGTHVFATHDVNLLPHLDKLVEIGLNQWKLDGLFTKGEAFVKIVSLFSEAREAIRKEQWTDELAQQFNEQLHSLHPKERSLDEGFFLKDPDEIESK